jgi:hypothetical protein
MKAGLLCLVLLGILVVAMFNPSMGVDAKQHRKREAAYHRPTSSGSSSDSDYSPVLDTTELSPITAGESGWDTATSTSFDPNHHRQVDNSTAEQAFVFTSSSPAAERIGASASIMVLVAIWGVAMVVV